MTRTWLAWCFLLVAVADARGQAPPVLSTVPTPPAGVSVEPAQMSGMPLQVGDLPPGIVVARVVRRSFQTNLPGQRVELRVGEGGNVLTATTGEDGRAQFTGLRVGEFVQLRTVVGAERLESQRFQLPAEAGIRLVLVADVGAPTASGPEWQAVAAALPAASSTPATATGAEGSIVSGVLLVLTLAMLAVVIWPTIRRRRASPREELIEQLVALEHRHAAGAVGDDVFRALRDQLLDDIATIDGGA